MQDMEEAQRLLHLWTDTSPRQASALILQPPIAQVQPIDGPTPKFCSCGFCIYMDIDCMNFCCGQSPCLSSTATFGDLTKESVLEVAGVTNYCDQFHQVSEYTNRNYRNQAYRFIILWQCNRMGKGKRVCPPSCCVSRIRYLYPSPDNVYTGYESFAEDIDDE